MDDGFISGALEIYDGFILGFQIYDGFKSGFISGVYRFTTDVFRVFRFMTDLNLDLHQGFTDL